MANKTGFLKTAVLNIINLLRYFVSDENAEHFADALRIRQPARVQHFYVSCGRHDNDELFGSDISGIPP